MSISPEQEITLRKVLAAKVAEVPEAGYVLPTPNIFAGKSDFWAQCDPTKTSQSDIEKTLINATWIYFLGFVDDPANGHNDAPLVKVTYEFYVFQQYAQIRQDETIVADPVDAKMLKKYNDFVGAVLKLREEFQGTREIAELDQAEFFIKQTTSLIQPEFINNRSVCTFVPGVLGFSVRLRETVNILGEC